MQELFKRDYRTLPKKNCQSLNADSRAVAAPTCMIFTVRQLVEKCWEHKAKTFLMFVDLKKAYDSCEALWLALRKLDVPESLIDLISSFHCGMQAKIRLNNNILEPIYMLIMVYDRGVQWPRCFSTYTHVW